MSTPFLDHAQKYVKDAESSVRMLLTQAAEQGDYDSLEKISRIARELQRIGRDTNSPGTRLEIPIPADLLSYPKFSRNGEGKLRMIGWSKKKNGEYRHEAPKEVLAVLVETLEQSCCGGDPIPMDELLPEIVHPETGRRFPEYYARTYLRWLRELGLVKKFGHSGYGFTGKVGEDPGPIIEAHWKKLPILD
jgi:hypothetical protein